MKIIRWILVLPAAIIAMMFVYVLTINSTTHIPIPYIDYITEFIAGTISAGVFVSAGSYVAPTKKRFCAILLTVMFVIYSVYSVIDPYLLYADFGIFEAIIYKLGGISGCVVGISMTDEDYM